MTASFWRNRRVLVTGGTGFLGFHLVMKLCESGACVRSFSLPAKADHPLHSLPVDLVEGDVCDSQAVQKAADGCDIIFHTAGSIAMWGPQLETMRRAHLEGTRNILKAAGQTKRVVHTSSIVAVGATRHGAIMDEESPFNLAAERIDYVHAKRDAELLALDATRTGQDVIVVNPGYLVGPEDFEPSVMGKFCARVWRAHLTIAAPGGYNLVDVRDVALGHLLAAERGQTGRRYILGGENLSMSQFMRRLAKVAGMQPRLVPTIPLGAMWLAAGIGELQALKKKRESYPSFQHCRLNRYSWFVSSVRANRELGFRPRQLDESLTDAYAWFNSQRPVNLKGVARWWMRPAA